MAKGVSIKFISYKESVFKILKLIKLDVELKKHDKILLKPFLRDSDSPHTSLDFIEAVLEFCNLHKNPVAEVFIAEGSDGEDTLSLFESLGYRNLAEKHSVGLIDLNTTETQEVVNDDFLKFQNIKYPQILMESFIISLPKLSLDEDLEIIGSLSNMIGAYPSKHYSGFFSSKKNKLKKYPIKYAIHDIVKCKMPNLSIIDASDKGYILAGQPLELDKQSSKILNLDWKNIGHIKLISERHEEKKESSDVLDLTK